jgi:hypothetical protein
LREAYFPLAAPFASAGLTFAALSPLITSLGRLALTGVAGAAVFVVMAWIFTLGASEREFVFTSVGNMRAKLSFTHPTPESLP